MTLKHFTKTHVIFFDEMACYNSNCEVSTANSDKFLSSVLWLLESQNGHIRQRQAAVSSPTIKNGAFKCGHCQTHAHHGWYRLYSDSRVGKRADSPSFIAGKISRYLAQCDCCDEHSLWINEQMLYPDPSDYSPEPLPPEIGSLALQYYEEAASIATRSPRAASAMLRAALEISLRHIFNDNESKNLLELIRKNKHRLSQHARDVMNELRVTGNKALHPNQIDSQDQTSVYDMLWLLEYVCKEMITDHKRAKAILARSKNKKPPK